MSRPILAALTGALLAAVPAAAVAQVPFSAAVSPNPVVVPAGGAAVAVTVSTSTNADMREPIHYSFSGLPAGVTASPAQTVNPPYNPATFTFSAGAAVPAGSYSGVLTGTTSAASVTVNVTIIVQQPPIIDGIAPAELATGTRENTLRMVGRNFHPGALITSADPAVQVLRARVLSSTSAEVVVAVRSDAAVGRYRLDLRNPDGAAAVGGAMVRVRAASSVAAPLAVTAARILSPRPWQVVPEDERVHAHALLATTGMGTVTGTWLLDGVPFERFTRVVSGGHPLEVRSRLPIPVSFTGEHRLELVLEAPQSLPPQRVAFLQAPERRSGLRLLEPDPQALLDPASPVFRWSLVPGASGYEVEVRYRPRNAGEATPWSVVRRRVGTTEWWPERQLLDALRDAEAAVRVRPAYPGDAFGDPTPWRELRFERLEPDPGGEAAPPDPQEVGPRAVEVWSAVARSAAYAGASRDASPTSRHVELSIGSSTSATSTQTAGPPPQTRIQISSQTDVRGERLQHQLTGDFSASHDLGDPWRGRGENRNWVARLGAASGAVRPDLTIGFTPPSFLDRTELLPVFSSGGGVQGSIASSAGRIAYFQSARLAAPGDEAGMDPRIAAAAWELATEDGRLLVRAATLRVTEREIEGFSPGATGTAHGLLVAAELGPRLQLIAEAALGEHRPDEESFLDDRDGHAFRVSARGAAGTLGYSLVMSRTDEGFVNPANAGFTPAGVSGRSRAELSLSNTFYGSASLSGTFTHLRGGVMHGTGDARATENGANLTLALPVSTRVMAAVGGHVHAQRGGAVDELAIPAMARTRRGVEVTIAQKFGGFGLSQSISWQDLADTDSWGDQRVFDASVSAHGTVHRFVNLSASLSESRSEGAPDMGSTRQRLLSFQPALTIWQSRLRLSPRVALSRTWNELMDTDSRSNHYQLAARWSAPWTTVPLALELASDWSRSVSGFDESPPPFTRRTVLTLGLNWRADRSW